ncbi:MAG: hypothetical protein GF364_03620, partial [Candidatus Lokiarchaeota archaeon]|nr:hypothetical protein [Candidatus Lokiarchaeota archaeon]
MKIGKIKGISIKIHYSTLLIIILAGYSASSFYRLFIPESSILELIAFGLLSSLIILISILAHELMHSIISMKNGIDVKEIEFYFFGGVSKILDEPEDGTTEIKIAVVGPVTSLIIGGMLMGLSFFPLTNVFIGLTFFYLGFVNISLGLFNLLPAFPMDGGRVLRAILWNKRKDIISATRTATKVGRFIGASLIGWGFIQVFLFGALGGFWLVIMGSLLRQNATESYQQTKLIESLSYIKVDDIMNRLYPLISGDLTIAEAIFRYFMNYRRQHFLVEIDGDLAGILNLEKIKDIPMQRRKETYVRDIMQPIEGVPHIKQKIDGKQALKELRKHKGRSDLLLVESKENSS